MQKESISINTEERPFYYDASRLLLSSHLSPADGLSSEFGPEYRINEALKLNAQRLVGLSFKKKKYPATFFTKSQVRDPTSTVFRISYGDDAIPKAAEADYKSSMMKSKPFIPPEYKNFEDKPHQLPLFLKEKLYKTVKSRKADSTIQEDSNIHQHADQLVESNMHTQSRGEFLPSLPSYRNSKQHGISVNDFGRSTLGFGTPIRAGDLPDFPYFSPKARQQMNSESVPVLMSNVFLTGGINPEGLAPQDEAAVEYIVSEYHSKTRPKPPTAATGQYEIRTQTNSRSRLTKTAVTMSLARQNEKKREWEEVLYKNGPKQGAVDKFGTKLKATVGHLKTEREVKRKKVLSLLKTKNFNLFRPNTINNLHLLKDALLKE